MDNKHLSKIKVRTPQTMRISGLLLQQTDECTINLLPGWNGIGFTPIVNLPISEALADYYDEAADGDIIKSQNEFAIFSDDGAGHRLWRGNLSYLKAGEETTASLPAAVSVSEDVTCAVPLPAGASIRATVPPGVVTSASSEALDRIQ